MQGKKPYHKDDEASEPLFDSVDTSVFKQRATYKTFIALLDNYSAETGVQESTSNAERREVQDFIAAVMQTKPMQYCHLYCRAKNPGMVPAGQNDFANLLKTIWFELYRRSGQVDSSGFGTYNCSRFSFRVVL
jgi:poly(U)-specific endoribonuclease